MGRERAGTEIEITIDDLAFGGAGVGRHDGWVVFVHDTAPGDRVRARVRKSRRRHGEADLLEVVSPGPDRIEPPCPHVPKCGGCRLQHLPYDLSLAAKRSQIGEHLERIGHITGIDVREPEPAVSPFGYRNKMEYSSAPGPDGAVLGFHERGRWDSVLDLETCLLASPRAEALRVETRAWARDENLTGWDRREHVGDLRHLVLREGVTTGQLLASVVTTSGKKEAVARLVDRLRAVEPGLVGVRHLIGDGVAETTVDLPAELVWGRDYIEERIMDATLRLSADAFFQTNTMMTERLYGHVAEAARLDGDQVVYDLFAGVGSIGICLADGAREVVAIEIDEGAVIDARFNAEANGVANHTALAGDVRVVLREQGADLPRPDVAIIDPPRAGLSGGAVRRVLELAPPTLVYVSCQPATFADNAARFIEGGYALEYVQPVDMFPQTPHIEAVARFTRQD